MRKVFLRATLAGLLAGLVYAIWRTTRARARASDNAHEPRACVEPIEGACPMSHPVKAKLSSGIFHVPGGQNYKRTKPDRCYRDEVSAAADGLRRSQR